MSQYKEIYTIIFRAETGKWPVFMPVYNKTEGEAEDLRNRLDRDDCKIVYDGVLHFPDAETAGAFIVDINRLTDEAMMHRRLDTDRLEKIVAAYDNLTNLRRARESLGDKTHGIQRH